jgi:MFS family permease
MDQMNRQEGASRLASPWVQLVFGVICMAMIANMQYGWTLFVNPIDEKYHWGRAAIQVAFTIFVVTETWLVPVEGYLVDKYGPRPVVVGGGLLCAIAWAMNSVASSLPLLYLAAAIGGVGAGAVYGTCVGNALKWFPARRGLAAGITAAGFGMGSAATVVPIAHMIKSSGYEATFLWFGLGQGLVVFLLGMALYAPPAHMLAAVKTTLKRAVYNASPKQVLASPIFWVMYLMFVMMAAGGLMATAQLGPIAKDFGLHDSPVSILGLTLPALTFALTIVRQDRTRKHDVHRVRDRGGGDRRAIEVRAQPGGVRRADGHRVLRLGRNLQPVPGDVRRHLRPEVRGDQRGAAVHREGHGCVAGAVLERAHEGDWKLAGGLHAGSGDGRDCRAAGALRAEADAQRAYAEACT